MKVEPWFSSSEVGLYPYRINLIKYQKIFSSVKTYFGIFLLLSFAGLDR